MQRRGTPDEARALSMSWWDLTGRISVGVPHLLTGAGMLMVSAGAATRGGGSGGFFPVSMGSLGLLFLLAGCLAFTGRWLLPLALALLSLATVAVGRLGAMGASTAMGDRGPFWDADTIWLATASLWLAAALPGPRTRKLAAVLAVPLAFAFLFHLPARARSLGLAAAQCLEEARAPTRAEVGDRVGKLRFAADSGRLELGGIGDDTTWVLSFWASWCAPCLAEMPRLIALGEELGRDAGGSRSVRFLAVNTEERPVSEVRAFLDARGWPAIPAVVDTFGVQDRLGVVSIPVVFVVRGGVIVERIDGLAPDMEARIRAALSETRELPAASGAQDLSKQRRHRLGRDLLRPHPASAFPASHRSFGREDLDAVSAPCDGVADSPDRLGPLDLEAVPGLQVLLEGDEDGIVSAFDPGDLPHAPHQLVGRSPAQEDAALAPHDGRRDLVVGRLGPRATRRQLGLDPTRLRHAVPARQRAPGAMG